MSQMRPRWWSGQALPLPGPALGLPGRRPERCRIAAKDGRPLRIDDHARRTGAGTDTARELGVGAAVGVPVIVDGRAWGAVTLGVAKDRLPLPADTVDRLTAFTDLVATAIANAEARTEIGRLAEEQAALRRVATLVAKGTQPDEVFAAVAEEIGRNPGCRGSVRPALRSGCDRDCHGDSGRRQFLAGRLQLGTRRRRRTGVPHPSHGPRRQPQATRRRGQRNG